jgi:hypothetical protein
MAATRGADLRRRLSHPRTTLDSSPISILDRCDRDAPAPSLTRTRATQVFRRPRPRHAGRLVHKDHHDIAGGYVEHGEIPAKPQHAKSLKNPASAHRSDGS